MNRFFNILSNGKRRANSIFTSIFNWFKTSSETNNPTRRTSNRPAVIDVTEGLQCNIALTKGLYHNSYPGMKLAGSMCYTPIATVLWLMGVPIPKCNDNDNVQKILDKITEDMLLEMYEIHKQCHRDGTCWIYPYFDTKENKVKWEFISDEIITDIIKDIDTNSVIKILTDEQITLSTGYNQTATIRRQKTFTETKVEKKYVSGTSTVPGDLKDRVQRNIAGLLPIPFANNKDGDETRGHSDYERILSDLKSYHDIELKEILLLSKFDPKMVQTVNDVNKWISNNGYSAISDIQIDTIDLIFNLPDEKTEFIFPQRAYEAYEAAKRNLFRKIVEGSGIPEILWGTKVEGNKASADQQMDLVVKLVEDKRIQKKEFYTKLFAASVNLELMSTMTREDDFNIEIEWNNLDAISEETKSIIFKNFADGMGTLINSAGITKEQAYKLWDQLYPNATEDDFKLFKKGLSEMAIHKQYKDAPFELVADMQGLLEPDSQPDGNGNGDNKNVIKILQEAIKNNKINLDG